MNFEGADAELLNHWLQDMKLITAEYKEPFLDTATVDFIKLACDTLKQDSHVFIMAVDILDSYVSIKSSKNKKVDNQLLTICAIIFVCSKHAGEQSDLKAKYIETLYERISKCKVTSETVRLMEIDVLKTLGQRLPLCSQIDDLKVLLEIYTKPMCLKVDVMDLCIELLDLVYIHYKALFFKIKDVYSQNPTSLKAFRHIVINRFYLPSGVLICALRLTRLRNVVDVRNLTSKLCNISNIHCNHLELLADKIYLLINSNDD